jgi:hypothetical protein
MASYVVEYKISKSERPLDEATFKVQRDAFIKEFPNGKVVDELPASLAIRGYIGRWYRIHFVNEGKKWTAEGNLFLGKHYAYVVMVMFETATSVPNGDSKFVDVPPSARKFINSFSLIDPDK